MSLQMCKFQNCYNSAKTDMFHIPIIIFLSHSQFSLVHSVIQGDPQSVQGALYSLVTFET